MEEERQLPEHFSSPIPCEFLTLVSISMARGTCHFEHSKFGGRCA